MKIFFDLDGTLLDSRSRLYALFQSLVPVSAMSFDQYWELKRNKINHAEILRSRFDFSENDIREFGQEWMSKIESASWLALDVPFEGVTDFLLRLKMNHALYLVTARQFRSGVLDQLQQYQWGGIFKEVLVTGGKIEKVDLVARVVAPGPEDWLVGDTGKDIETGRALGTRTAAVLTGFLSRERLKEYNPDVIVDSVLSLPF